MDKIKIWVDIANPAPEGYHHWFKSADETIDFIETLSALVARGWNTEEMDIELIDLDREIGVLEYLEREMYDIPIRIHSGKVDPAIRRII